MPHNWQAVSCGSISALCYLLAVFSFSMRIISRRRSTGQSARIQGYQRVFRGLPLVLILANKLANRQKLVLNRIYPIQRTE